jgi:hypothetical protein
MASVTYQQLLAETYKENENLQEDFTEEEEPDVDGHEEHEYDTKELADPDAFKKFGGNRGHPETISKPAPFEDKSKLSVRHEKDIKTIVLNIDSRFRAYSVPNLSPHVPVFTLSPPNEQANSYKPSDPAHYVMQTHTPIRNVYSVKLTSVEFPNVFYEFDKSLYVNTELNITIGGTTTLIAIPDGNYSTSNSLASTLQASLNDSLSDFTVFRDPISNRITITHTGVFDITFVTRITNSITGQVVNSTNPYKNGLGYYLGFSQTNYTGLTSYTAELIPTIVANNYVYLVLNDWNVVQHQSYNNAHFSAFSKLLITGPKNTLFFDTASSNSTTKEIFFQQPIDITRIEMQLLDPYGNQLNLRGADFSITLEIKQILNMSLFEKLREL